MSIQLNCGRCGRIIKYVTAKEVRDKYSTGDEPVCDLCQKFTRLVNEETAKLEKEWIKKHGDMVEDFRKTLNRAIEKIDKQIEVEKTQRVEEQFKIEKKLLGVEDGTDTKNVG